MMDIKSTAVAFENHGNGC